MTSCYALIGNWPLIMVAALCRRQSVWPPIVGAYADRLEGWPDSQVVGRHDRAFGRARTIHDPLHDIPVLACKPGALRSEPRGRYRFETRDERAVQGLGPATEPAPASTQARMTARRRPAGRR